MAFDLSTAKPVRSGGFDINTAKPFAAEKQAQHSGADTDPESVEPIIQQHGRTANAQRIASERERISGLLEQYKSGGLSSQDVNQQDMESIQKARIEEIPELTGSFKKLSKNLGFMQAIGGLTAFDPDEFGAILQKADPNIGVVTTPEGERLAINRATNEIMSINKVGPSLVDALQAGGAWAMFTPSGKMSTIPRQAASTAVTQSAIEAGQKELGGEFNPEDVLIATGAVPVVSGILKYGKGAIENFRNTVRSAEPLINAKTGAVNPKFEKALNKYDIDVGALIDDQANLPVIYSADKPDKVVDQIIKNQIKTGKTSKYLAKLRLDNKGNIIDDDLGKKAVNQGFDPGDVVSVKHSNEATRAAQQEMLKKQRAIMADSSMVDNYRPSDEVGNSVMDRILFVRKEASRLADELERMSSRELSKGGQKLIGESSALKGVDIDPSTVQQSVYEGLKKLNIQSLDDYFKADGKPIFKAINDKGFFDGSTIMEDPTSQRIIKKAFNILKYDNGTPIDALRAHETKRMLDALIDFNKKSSQGLTDKGRDFLKQVRYSINQSIRDVSPKYAKINDDLSMAINALNAIEDSVGRRIDIFDLNANQAIGTDLRKLLSNYGVRQTLNNSLNTLDDAAKNLGGNFETDYRSLNRFANVLDKRFGSVAENSFTGDINKALDLNRLRSTSIKEAVIEKGLSPLFGKISDKFGPNDKEAMETMRKILIRGK